MEPSVSSVQEILERHERSISRGERFLNRCRRCQANGSFTRHELRRRRVRFIVDLVVQVLSVVIARWRCTRCHHVFTDLPSFLLPHRRYASVSLMPLAQAYLESDQRSYQSIVAPQGRVMGYATPAGQPKIDERALHRSTLWRFLRFLGSQTAALEEGLRLWNQWDPGSTLHRFMGAVAPHKYRGEHRQQILRTAQRLLKLIDRWDRTFGESFFPRFATRPRGP